MKIEEIREYIGEKVDMELYKKLPKYIKEPGGMVSSTGYTRGRLTRIIKNDDKIFVEIDGGCKTDIQNIKNIKIQEKRNDIVSGELITPLGIVKTYIDGKETPYMVKECETSKCYPDVVAIYSIKVNCPIDNKEHSISCEIPDLQNIKYEYEYTSGEREYNFNIEHNNLALSISCDAESYDDEMVLEKYNAMLFKPEEILENYLQYSSTTSVSESTKNGILYKVFNFSKRGYVVFGVSWIEDVGNDCWDGENYSDRSFQAEFASNHASLGDCYK